MATQGSILTFDEARQASRRPRPSVAPSRVQKNKPTRRDSNRFTAGEEKKSTSQRRPSVEFGKKTKASERITRATPSSRIKRNDQKRPSAEQAKERAQKRQEEVKRTQASQSSKLPKISKFSELRKNAKKSKADRQFSKQFETKPSHTSSEGPRAAVYKAEMGRQHKKITKMNENVSSKSSTFFSKFSFVGPKIKASPKFLGAAMVVVCLALSVVFLYPTAQQYYVTYRDYEQTLAEHQALETRNKDIQTQVTLLSSEAGIEDRAREQYGWVKQGEKAVTVHGLSSQVEEETIYKTSIPAGSVEAPSNWLTSIFDVVFGVA